VNAKKAVIVGYAVIAAFAVARVSATRRVFSATYDEPMHLACGLDWLYGRPYTAQPDNPPLARIAAALPFALARAPVPAATSPDNMSRGNAVLYSGDYRENVARARAGNLVFLVAGILATGAWTARRFGRASGLAAAALFAWLPPVRAHAGLATTDMAAAATFALALVAFDRWRDHPTPGRASALGAAAAAGILSKFSFVPFFAIAVAIVAAARRVPRGTRGLDRSALLAAAIASSIIWAGYRFEVGTAASAYPAAGDFLRMAAPPAARGAAVWLAANVPVPAPLLLVGAAELGAENAAGHPGFLLGRMRTHGWWYYFPVALFFKTPIPFLALALAGIAAACRREGRALDAALMPIAMLLSVLPSSIDIGVRHLLPLYVPLSAAAGCAAVRMARKPEWRFAAAVLVAWTAIGAEAAHPDYLSWFNEAAGPHPERILSDSNLDWGQDWLRLTDVIARRHIRPISVLFSGTVLLQNHLADRGAELVPLAEDRRAPGWYALPEGALATDPDARRGAYAWLDDYAFARIGKSIRLYHVPR